MIDAGIRRNRFAEASHGLLTQDGRPPADIVADGRAELLKYGTVEFAAAPADRAEAAGDGFRAFIGEKEPRVAKRPALATGVRDEWPDCGTRAMYGRKGPWRGQDPVRAAFRHHPSRHLPLARQPRAFRPGIASDTPECLIEQAVGAALGQTLKDAEQRLLARFGESTLANLAADFEARRGRVKPAV